MNLNGQPTSYWAAAGVVRLKNRPPLSQLLELTSEYFGVSVEDLKLPRRDQHISIPRHMFMWIAFDLFRYTSAVTAKEVNRTHASLLHAVKKIQGLMQIRSKDAMIAINYKQFVINKLTE